MFKKYFFIFFIASIGTVQASGSEQAGEGRWSIVINGLSKHFDTEPYYKEKGLNERNWGIGIQYDLPKRKDNFFHYTLNAGEYRDSERKTAVYAGAGALVELYKNQYGYLRAGIELAAFHSPSYNNSNFFIAPLPVLNIGNNSISINLSVIPRVKKYSDSGVAFLQLKIGY